MPTLRPYQVAGIERVLELFRSGVRRVLLVLPTGGGKTVVASELVTRVEAEWKCSALFLAHRRELVKQAFCKLVRNGLPAEGVGVIMSGVEWRVSRELGAPDPSALDDAELWERWARRRPPARTQVGSIDTFRNKARPELGAPGAVGPSGLVVVDEAHRALAKSYVDVAAAYPQAFHLGLTATPFRADGKGLEGAYDEIVVISTYAELVAEGFLVEPMCYGSKHKADLSGVRKNKGDYNADDLAKAVDRGELVGDIVEHWLERGNNAATIAFAVNVPHSRHLAERFNAAGIPAVHVDANTPSDERDRAFADLRAGRVKILCNVDVATEGTDVPCVKTIILARPTTSERVYLQQVGRGARPWEGRPFVVLDHAGCCSDPALGGLPQEPREFTLSGSVRKARKGLTGPQTVAARECPACRGLNVPTAPVCVACGFEFPPDEAPKPITEAEGKLELLTLSDSQAGILREWRKMRDEWEWRNLAAVVQDRMCETVGALRQQWAAARRAAGDNWPAPAGVNMPWPPPPKGAKIPKLTDEQIAHNKRIAARNREEARAEDGARRGLAKLREHRERWAQ